MGFISIGDWTDYVSPSLNKGLTEVIIVYSYLLSDVFLVSHWIRCNYFSFNTHYVKNSETAVISLVFIHVLIFQRNLTVHC